MKILHILSITLCTISTLYGQPDGRHQQIEAKKIAFITEALDLTVTEAQQFWPVYNAHQAETKKIKQRHKSSDLDAIDKMSDAEAEAALTDLLARLEAEHRLQKTYIAELKQVLPVTKVAKLMHLETAFKRRLLKAMSSNRQERMNRKTVVRE